MKNLKFSCRLVVFLIAIAILFVTLFPVLSYFPTERQTVGLLGYEPDMGNEHSAFYFGYEIHPTKQVMIEFMNGDVMPQNRPGVAFFFRYLYRTNNIHGPQLYMVYETRWWVTTCSIHTQNPLDSSCHSWKQVPIPAEPEPEPDPTNLVG